MLNPQPSWPNPPAPLYAFPDGFQMIAGEKTRRNYTALATDFSQDALSQRALGFNCLNYTIAPEPSLYRHFMPNRTFLENQCGDGLRLELAFPSCWNGVDIDSADHKSHMAYPSTVLDGYCPPGFQTKTPTLFFETIWNVWEYKGYEGEYYLSTGDPTGKSLHPLLTTLSVTKSFDTQGYGYHGDFQMGWSSTDFLQQAVNNCTNLSGQIQDCPLFDIQPDQLAATCSFPIPSQVAYDNAAGPRLGLPVGVPIQSGPAQASLYPIVSVNSLYQSFTLGVQSMESTVLISTVASNSNSVVPTIVSSNIQNVTQPVLSTTPVSAQLGTTATTIVTSSSSRKTSSSVKVSSTATAMPTATITSIVQNTGNGAAQGTAAVKPLSTVFTTLATEVLEIIYVQTTVTVTSQAMVYEESDGDVITYRKKREEADEEEEGEEVEQEEQKQESIHRHLGVRHWFNHF